MEYTLLPNHRNVSDEELIADLIAVSRKIGENKITRNEYNREGKYSEGTLRKRFGSWGKALDLAGLSSVYSYNVSKKYVVEELKRIARKNNKDSVTIKEYKRDKQAASVEKIKKLFGTWENSLIEAGLNLSSNYHRKYTEEELFENLMQVWISLNRQPKLREMNLAPSTICSDSYKRKYGSWQNALEKFVDYTNAKEVDKKLTNIEDLCKTNSHEESTMLNNVIKHRTQRNINLRLRFLILKRDKFSCVSCGRSPAKDGSVILHVDHIIPWAEGGETIEENLQTLCSKCNLGKSEVF